MDLLMQVTITIEVPHLGSRIKAAVDSDGRSPTVVAAMAEMSVANLYRIMSEETKSVPLDTLRRLSSVLGLDFESEVKLALFNELGLSN